MSASQFSLFGEEANIVVRHDHEERFLHLEVRDSDDSAAKATLTKAEAQQLIFAIGIYLEDI